MSPLRTPAVIRPLGRNDAERVLICLGFCGGGTGAYRAWAPLLPSNTDLALVCYPGREGRFAEPFPRTWEDLARDTVEVVRRVIDRPYVMFGHSMGGWMAFDVTVRLEKAGDRLPDMLIASSCNSPNRGVTDRDRFPHIDDSDEELAHWMEHTGSLPDYVASDPDLRGMAIELMRADVKVRDSYHPPQDACTIVPVQVLVGTDDGVIEPSVADQWSAVAMRGCHVDWLPGGHFYTPQTWARLPEQFRALAVTATP